MTPNERYNATIAALLTIAEDPNETPARREKAERALQQAQVSVDGSSASRGPTERRRGQ